MSTPTIDNRVEVVFSFDTTGSMYPCLAQVRKKLGGTVSRLMKEIPGMRIGIIAHGDYCDEGSTYVTKVLDLTDDKDAIVRFVERVEPTGGGDAPECYELVLNQARTLSWTPGYTKVFVLIGDDVPHGKSERQNKDSIDWREEVKLLGKSDVKVYGIQALDNAYATKFYETISEETGGFYLELKQFENITDTILAIAYKQQGNERLQQFETEVKKSGRVNRTVLRNFDRMLGRKVSSPARGLDSVDPGRFQVLKVDRDCAINEFVEENGLTFGVGRGFYEFTKPVMVQGHKEVVIQEKATGDMYTGAKARQIAGIPAGVDAKVSPGSISGYRCFIQSTSSNRKLLKNTHFLYEV